MEQIGVGMQAKKAGASLMHPDALAALPGVGQNAITRRAGGRLSNKPQPKRIVIDVREFMGSLPAVLHQQGLEIVPVTLEVRIKLRCHQQYWQPPAGKAICMSGKLMGSRPVVLHRQGLNRASHP